MTTEARYILALSGGGDSVCLFHLLRQSHFSFEVFHCNYQLRGIESDEDELFVRNLCEGYGIKYHIKRFDTSTIVEREKGNVQEVARKIRYSWFRKALENEKFDAILTGHHFNDNLETSLFNFSRGTDIKGLVGIPESNDGVLRPLLQFKKSEIEAYLASGDFAFRTDSSNFTEKYSRNKIRMSIVPAFHELFEDVENRMALSLSNLKQADLFIQNQINKIREELFQDWDYGKRIELKKLKDLEPLEWILKRLFSPYGFHDGKEIAKIMGAETGKYIASDQFRLIHDRDRLLLTGLTEEAEEYIVEENCKELKKPIYISIEYTDQQSQSENFDVEFDYDKFEFPLTIRTWRRGDYFYPKGMHGKKKLSDFYSDLKLSLPEKENTWLICSGGDVMYIVGHRQDKRFMVDENTTRRVSIQH